jgi:membrane-associated phospholipid phosphatase
MNGRSVRRVRLFGAFVVAAMSLNGRVRAAELEPSISYPDWVSKRASSDLSGWYGAALELGPTLVVSGVAWHLESLNPPASQFSDPWKPDHANSPQPYKRTPDLVSNWTGGFGGSILALVVPLSVSGLAIPEQLPGWKVAGMDFVVALESTLWTLFATQLLKTTFWRCRPAAYEPETDTCSADSAFGRTDGVRAFPSGHTSTMTAIATTYLWTAMRTRSSDTTPGVVRWTSFGVVTAMSAATAYLRVESAAHSSSDAVAGAGLGAVIGTIVSLAHPIASTASETSEAQLGTPRWHLGVWDRQLTLSLEL